MMDLLMVNVVLGGALALLCALVVGYVLGRRSVALEVMPQHELEELQRRVELQQETVDRGIDACERWQARLGEAERQMAKQLEELELKLTNAYAAAEAIQLERDQRVAAHDRDNQRFGFAQQLLLRELSVVRSLYERTCKAHGVKPQPVSVGIKRIMLAQRVADTGEDPRLVQQDEESKE